MKITGKVAGASFGLDGSLIISFAVNEKGKALEELEDIKKLDRLTIEAKKYRERRSIDANAYFWKLCDMIAKKLNTDKMTIYLMQLSDAGVFTDVAVINDALPVLQRSFRYTEAMQDTEIDGKPGKIVRCYAGSSTYNTEEMSHLINSTVRTAKSLGIETMTPDEQAAMIASWKGANTSIEKGY